MGKNQIPLNCIYLSYILYFLLYQTCKNEKYWKKCANAGTVITNKTVK